MIIEKSNILKKKLLSKIDIKYQKSGFFDKDNIYTIDFKECLGGDNEKYMKMYNWMSYGMDYNVPTKNNQNKEDLYS